MEVIRSDHGRFRFHFFYFLSFFHFRVVGIRRWERESDSLLVSQMLLPQLWDVMRYGDGIMKYDTVRNECH